MLQQILDDLFIDPEILALLDEAQKQTLFVKMREEQVRRWKLKEEEFEKEEYTKPANTSTQGSKAKFRAGADGEVWVWVMGEHHLDLSIDEILEQEAHRVAEKIAEREAATIREKEELDLNKMLDSEKNRIREENRCIEKDMKEKEDRSREAGVTEKQLQQIELLRQASEKEEQKCLEQLNVKVTRQRRQSVKVFESNKSRRSVEIYTEWKEHRVELEKKGEEENADVENSWKEQELKAKEAETEMRSMAQRARVECGETVPGDSSVGCSEKSNIAEEKRPVVPSRAHLSWRRKSFVKSAFSGSLGQMHKPGDRAAIINWFKNVEKTRCSCHNPTTNKFAEWFHGVISRGEAEKLLSNKKDGTFLLRVSDRIWGYTVSCRDGQHFKHFLICTGQAGYQFIGACQVMHKTLAELVDYHKHAPITVLGQELLLHPCGQTSDPPDYADLLSEISVTAL